MAGLYASRGAKTAVLSKLYPVRSHTGAAQGGVGAALGSEEEDRVEWHTYDTVKGSDFLGDQDTIEFMCEEAVPTIYELEHMGLPFNRTAEGKIAQRPFGGHTNNETGKPVRRACYAADRTGHMILQTLCPGCPDVRSRHSSIRYASPPYRNRRADRDAAPHGPGGGSASRDSGCSVGRGHQADSCRARR